MTVSRETLGGVSAFTLKIAAIITMACNHVANVFCTLMPDAMAVVLYSLGGVTFPIMCFLLTEGYHYTSNVRKYAARLAVFAVVSQIPYSLLWGATPNVLFTLLVCLGVIWAYDNLKPRWAFWLIALVAYFGTQPFDWGGIGIAMALLFHVLRGKRYAVAVVMLVAFIAAIPSPIQSLAGASAWGISIWDSFVAMFDMNPETTAMFFSYPDATNVILQSGLFVANFSFIGYFTVGFGLAAALILLYDGRRGRPIKFFFYAFYPAHLMLIWLLSLFLV